MREAKARGTDIERCSEGLPMNMLMPDASSRLFKFSSSMHNHGAATPGVRTPSTSGGPSRVPPLSAIEGIEPIDSPPRKFLTELVVDGVDPPVPTTPNKTRTSHGDLSKLDNIEVIEAFLARRAESPDWRQVPCDKSPRIHYGPGEREALFKAYCKKPASVFLNYFHILERVPDPPMPEPCIERLGWPTSRSTPGHSPIDAIPQPILTERIPIAVSKRE